MVMLWLLSFSFAKFSLLVLSQSNSQGFISVDCGISDNSSYVDPTTKITYESDDKYIDTGKSYKVASNYRNAVSYQAQTVRSFPAGDRNCYMFANLTINGKYFIRATFLYGNYDGLQSVKPKSPLLFDLYIGVNKWATINISDASKEYTYEIVSLMPVNFTWICLLNTKLGTPFISTIELRPIKGTMYPYATANQSNAFVLRYNFGPTTNQIIRYPDDQYDRIWSPFSYDTTVLKEISNPNANITRYSNDYFEVPFMVLRTAITTVNFPNLTIITNLEHPNDPNFVGYYMSLHFTELQGLKSNESREFITYADDELWYEAYMPRYLYAGYIYAPVPRNYPHYEFLLAQTQSSALPPLINAIEFYAPLPLDNSMTAVQDVNAIFAIKAQYGMKGSWSGDPCTTSLYAWSGLGCRYSIYDQPRIISVNLSSSNLTGTISDYFSMLSELRSLDLACNSLTGEIPNSLTNLLSLQVLNLSGNNFTGSVPASLKARADSGFLNLTTGEGSCASPLPPPSPAKKKATLIIVLSVAIPVLLLIIASVLYFALRRKGQEGSSVSPQPPPVIIRPERSMDRPKIGTEFHRFTYTQLQSITNNFTQVIGRGGFGTVYLGTIDDKKEVAVKISQTASDLVTRQFLAEEFSFSNCKDGYCKDGYCKDGDILGIVYEYMSQGRLGDHLRGKAGIAKTLNWSVRLRISLEAAQGLDYLHTGCGIIHRDVNSNNILLDQNLTAKVADFGFSKMIGNTSAFSSLYICGTPGYIDPQANEMQKLTEGSDVYSFGVVLWEIITGEPAIKAGQVNINIVDMVKQRLSLGSIEELADKRLNKEFNPQSVWRVVDLANRCTGNSSSERPTMAEVAAVLKESLAVEMRGEIQRGESGHEICQPSTLSGDISQASIGPIAR